MTRAVYRYASGHVDRDLVIRRSSRERACDAWDRGCEATIQRGELHGANRYGLAHICLACCEVVEPEEDDDD